ncbi:Lhr family ATP-dependent helicase [Actinotalea subterranea]|uniref:Lhr family ATP-dependent helicase n=1 Tax=Actinotalea subterranea TaxID=2607497 RepID=UPI0011EE7DE0|nr:DEAD/DEAH box helicase [Actinotalea subterranea]
MRGPGAGPGALAGFSEPTRAWFTGAFDAPTPAQQGAWAAIGAGDHSLVVAPTGSGKTLAAFLWSIDAVLTEPPPDDPALRCRVLYVSPLKALAADVERNLRSPLVGIRQAAARLGLDLPEVRVGVRTGDTPANERRQFATRPPDVLITTPESLFLVLTSGAREGLRGVRTVILDEIHAVAGTKRGAHLAVTLERLDALLESPPPEARDEGGQGHLRARRATDGPAAAAGRPAQRIGLSATVRPVDVVAGFLAGARTPADGGRAVTVVQPPSTKEVDVRVVVPVPDLGDLGSAGPVSRAAGSDDAADGRHGLGGPQPIGPDLSGPAAGRPARPSIWPHVEERIVDLVAQHRSTLVFTNSRRGAERLTARMNEVWAERQGADVPDPGSLTPAQAPGQSGVSVGIDGSGTPVLARAHHGSMSRAERTHTESELKAGRLPAVVATSSLELGIDMGAVDLVVQVGSPPSVASGLQRIGRAGHQVGAVSRGVVFPTFRGDLVPAAVSALRMRAGSIEQLHVLTNPLDVLAQQVVAMLAVDDWSVEELAACVRRAAPFSGLGDATLRAVLDMLAGRYPSEEFAELRPRIVWDRTTDLLSGRPGALRLAVTSGGTIPDRGLYGVFLATGAASDDVPADTEPGPGGTRLRGGKRVGELDEEMVYESRVGDTFTLGSSTWRIEEITPDRVLVTPAPGLPGRLPFWKGDSPGRPAELGAALGAWVREVAALPADAARALAAGAGLDTWAADNLVAYVTEQREATGVVPDDTTVVVERFRDEIGDWRIVVHSPYGARVHAPWALVIGARLREKYGLDAAAMHADDGIVLRLPDLVTSGSGTWDVAAARWVEADDGPVVELADLLIEPDEVVDAVRTELGGSALFAARFREAAARALMLPRRRPDKRQPLWQQRQRSAQLLTVAARYPDFPILLEAARECLQDDYDVAALSELMRSITAGRVRVVEVTTRSPSPFAQSLLFGYTAQFLYDGDAPLAERRAAALTLDPTLLAELLGQGGSSQLADLLDPPTVERTEAELMAVAPERQAKDLEGVADIVRRHGPLTRTDLTARTREEARPALDEWLATLTATRRLITVRLGPDGIDHWAAVEDAGRLRDAFGVALPVGVPEVFTELVPDALGDLVRRHARTHGPFTAAQVAGRFGVGIATVTQALRALEQQGVVACGRLRPDELGGTGEDYCDTEVLRLLRRRSLAALRAEVEPVPQQALAQFLPRWQGVVDGGRASSRLRGVDGLARVVEQLAGVAVPASALESLVLPARVTDYSPAMLDELTASGEVVWAGHASLAAQDGMVSLHPASTADLTLPEPTELSGALDSPVHVTLLEALAGGGAFFLEDLLDRCRNLLLATEADAAAVAEMATAGRVTDALWELVWSGRVTNDGLAPLRARLGSGTGRRPGGTAHPTRRAAPRARAITSPLVRGLGRPRLGEHLDESGLRMHGLRRTGAGRADASGRWSALPAREADATVRAHALALQLLDRHGIVTRAVAPSEGVAGQFGAVYRVLAALEQAGQVRRGYFVEHLGGSQFALPAAVDLVREEARSVAAVTGDLGPLTGPLVQAADPEAPGPVRGPREPGEPNGAAVPGEVGGAAPVVVLAATDPANPYGAALGWPEPPRAPTPSDRPGPGSTQAAAGAARAVGRPATAVASDAPRHRPGRKAGALVVLVAGALVLYVERGGRTVLSFSQDHDSLAAAAHALATTARTGRLGRLTLQRADGAELVDRETLATPLARALSAAGFGTTPRGLRLNPAPGRQ